MFNFTPVQNMIFVSEEDARNYMIPPNSKVLLMSKDKPVFYVKTTDTLGQSTFDTYKFEKIQPAPQIDPNVVTRADLEAFKSELIALLATTAQSTTTTTEPQEENKNA